MQCEDRDVDTLRQNRIVEDDKLARLIATPVIKSLKKLLASDFSLVDICTM